MASENLKVDENNKPVIGLVTDDSNQFIKMGRIDDTSKGLKVMIVGGVGTGTVTSISQSTGILLTPNPITTTGTVGLSTSLAPMATLSGNALKVLRVNAGETALEYVTQSQSSGTVTSVSIVSNAGVTGSVATATTTPAITISLGAISPSTVNGLAISTTTGTFTLANSKTLTVSDNTTLANASIVFANGKTLGVSNTLTFAGTDSTIMTFPTTSATIARTDAANTFTGVQTFSTPLATGSVATMTASVGGGVPTPPNNTTTFLRGDGTFAAPAAGSIWSCSRNLQPQFLANATYFGDFNAAGNTTIVETNFGNLITRIGTLRNFYVDPNQNTLNAGTGVFTIMVNGVASSITLTVNAGVTTIVSDTTHTASVVAGDRVTIRGVLTGATGGIYPGFSIQID